MLDRTETGGIPLHLARRLSASDLAGGKSTHGEGSGRRLGTAELQTAQRQGHQQTYEGRILMERGQGPKLEILT